MKTGREAGDRQAYKRANKERQDEADRHGKK